MQNCTLELLSEYNEIFTNSDGYFLQVSYIPYSSTTEGILKGAWIFSTRLSAALLLPVFLPCSEHGISLPDNALMVSCKEYPPAWFPCCDTIRRDRAVYNTSSPCHAVFACGNSRQKNTAAANTDRLIIYESAVYIDYHIASPKNIFPIIAIKRCVDCFVIHNILPFNENCFPQHPGARYKQNSQSDFQTVLLSLKFFSTCLLLPDGRRTVLSHLQISFPKGRTPQA